MNDISSAITYHGAPRGPRYEAWREEICRGFARTDFDPKGSERVEFDARVAAFSGVAAVVFRTGRFIRSRNIVALDSNDFLLAAAAARAMRGSYGGRDVDLLPNQMGLIEVNSLSTLDIRESGRLVSIRIPRDKLLSLCPNAGDRLGRPLSNDPSLRDMIARYTAMAIEHAPRLDVVAQHTMAQYLIDLIGLLLGTGRDQSELAKTRGYAEARFELIRADLLDNLGHGDLTVDRVAGRYGLSARQLQRLFERHGVTFTEFVLENRLRLARRLLLDRHNPVRKISDIAHAAGFGDLSYFNRAFRKRFGASPTAIREASWRLREIR